MPDQNQPDGPRDPFGAMAEAAAAIHEVFLSYVAAGFTESQALYLTACALTGGPKAPPQ